MSYTFRWEDIPNAVNPTYESTLYLPDLEDPQTIRGQVFRTLDLGTFWLRAARAGQSDLREPRTYTLHWDVADDDFLPVAQDTFQSGRSVTVTLPNRITATAADRWETGVTVTGYVTAFEPKERGGKLMELTLTVQEVRV